MNTVLVVDDKEMMRDSVGGTLQRGGFRVRTASDGEAALAQIASSRPDAVVTDLKMPGMTGLELLERIRQIDDDLPCVLMTAFGTVETAVKAIKLGAFDYVTKPFEGDELIIAVKRAIQHAHLVRENAVLRVGGASGGGGSARGVERIIGDSPAIRRVKEQVQAVADSHGTVLIVGESGAGKEVVARAIHDLSSRRDEPFLAVNCAALSESLLESELFGHERGAFTGAERLRKGRFELADRGTLLLDEVSEISPALQAKLLRVLQERTFERVGSSVSIGVDVRVIATSNRDLPRAVERGEFRQDLFFRLNVLPIHLPPLRDRLEDVRGLARHFVREVCAREGREVVEFEEGALAAMERYSWPGNVRELQNVCERAVVLLGRGEGVIRASLVEPWLAGASVPVGLGTVVGGAVERSGAEVEGKYVSPVATGGREDGEVFGNRPVFVAPPGRTLEEIERETIIQTLERFGGHRAKTAKSLGIGVRTLGLKLKKWKEERLVPQSL